MRKIQLVNADIHTGKDNFSELIATEFDLRIISLGDLIRTEYKAESETGLKIKEYIDKGVLLPIEFVNTILENQILRDTKDLLMVNYPKTQEQFVGFKSLFNHLEIQLDKIWHLRLINLSYVAQKEFMKLGTMYTAKYEITTDTLLEKIKLNQENTHKLIELWKVDYGIETIDVDYEHTNDMRSYFMEKIKSA
ncbi:nucleoside monophosphate kinase [Fluviicola taffensis]|uniref:Adenylate kinase n=1 Tax=Fluviicola taffensis (strain DSM 16823 / NCIMB 13979 / RW262) TaxID=755732 RepID=F2IHX8_FLUTR|nr:nucleoside monophosphate kinase [Fluviicola taffensis]AEA45937.1 adenylate kinase [Fluviicola taffensis DSM 16823]